MSEPRQYYPSNGTEGDCFIHYHCAQCIHEKFWHTQQRGDKQCNIFTETLFRPVPEWIYGEDGKPTCTKWQKWDWGRDDDGDGNGWNEPPELPPYNPNQLLLPFDGHEYKNPFDTPNETTEPIKKENYSV